MGLGLGLGVRVRVRVRARGRDDLERIDDVAETLGHLTAILVAHHRVQVDLSEWQLVGELQRAPGRGRG